MTFKLVKQAHPDSGSKVRDFTSKRRKAEASGQSVWLHFNSTHLSKQ